MDTEASWTVSDDVDSLIGVILDCKRDLTKKCFGKYGSAKIIEYNVCAPPKLCELLLVAGGHKPLSSKENKSYYIKSVATFEQFNLYRYKMSGDNIIRLEVKFDVGEGVGKYWYGNVTVTS